MRMCARMHAPARGGSVKMFPYVPDVPPFEARLVTTLTLPRTTRPNLSVFDYRFAHTHQQAARVPEMAFLPG